MGITIYYSITQFTLKRYFLVPDKLNSVPFWQKIENPHWGRAGRNSQFSIVNIQLKTSIIIKTLNFKLPF
jgi:hypothetical protein